MVSCYLIQPIISKLLNMSELSCSISDTSITFTKVAGATLLALGNGTPDVFTFVAAATRGGYDALIGFGALLGAIEFIISMVVGAVVLWTKVWLLFFIWSVGLKAKHYNEV